MLDLDRVAWQSTRHPGIWISFLESNRDTGYTVALIRMEPGSSYPAHRHRGSEELFVLEGAYEDERGRHGEGRFVRYEDGSTHHPRCPAGGTGCAFLAIAREGIDLLRG